MGAPDYYRQPPDALRADQRRSAEIEELLMEKLERWDALEARTSAKRGCPKAASRSLSHTQGGGWMAQGDEHCGRTATRCLSVFPCIWYR